MSATYSISNRERWRLHSDHETRLSEHSIDRWDERTPEDSVAPETAFDQSVDVSTIAHHLEDEGGQIPDEARFFYDADASKPYGIVFLVNRYPDTTNICKTIYRADMVHHGPTRAYLYAHRNEFGGGDE